MKFGPVNGRWAGALLAGCCAVAHAADWVQTEPSPGAFPLVENGRPAEVATSPEDFKVVAIAAGDLIADIERVTGAKPRGTAQPAGPAVLIGTLGHSPLIDDLVARHKLDATVLRGAWESFVIATVADPLPGVPTALVIAGSDRRGTAFGVYELSQAIGVSPWYWWADVTPARKSALHVVAGTRRFGPPSVQYRGIFINDEDWGLQPWAAKTFEPEAGDIGPKTYARVCELLLRLKANTLWPAMHPSTRPFNAFPANKHVADDYAIVMGSSHAEPMLRNNVGEWTAPKEAYDYVHNRDGVLEYWEQRMRENGRFENIYTLGMRGIHDSKMIGPKTDAERIATLERIFSDQRELIRKHAGGNAVGGVPNPDREANSNQSGSKPPPTNGNSKSVPQMFCAYKEVLALYRQGLKVPDDVTIAWPDDNFGYIRNFASAEERKRPGGFGVYYHLSYLGAPLSYLWLSTTPPVLIWSEMRKAYDHGANRIWIANVGDIKPAEIGMEFFLQLAWDIDRWHADNLGDFLPQWAAREFGPASAREIGAIMAGYHALNFVRRPEHLQWWLPGKTPVHSPFTEDAARQRLGEFQALERRYEEVRRSTPPALRDALFQLVGYPVIGSGLANQRYFLGEMSLRQRQRGERDFSVPALAAAHADQALANLTGIYNESTSGGKWRGILSLEPADDQWRSMRIAPWTAPYWEVVDPGAGGTRPDFQRPPVPQREDYPHTRPLLSIDAANFVFSRTPANASWRKLPGLGVFVEPFTAAAVAPSSIASEAPAVDYTFELPAAGEFTLEVRLLPTHPIVPGRGLRIAIALDGGGPELVTYAGADGSPEWAQGVLNNYVTAAVNLVVPTTGAHTLRLYGIDPGVVVREFRFLPGPEVNDDRPGPSRPGETRR